MELEDEPNWKKFNDPESVRLEDEKAKRHDVNWKRWGPYLSERQWGTVREDYSSNGDVWNSFTHELARSKAYRWGEDGILGLTDRECRLCFAMTLWNGKDPILKERLFGVTGPEGNHGEDVKEEYFYLESSPTHSYMKGLYKYPQAEFPYTQLVQENRNRSREEREYELVDTGVFNDGRYFDTFVEYAKNSPNDILIKVTVANRAKEAATVHLLPTLWYRNTWIWGCKHEGCWAKPWIKVDDSKSRKRLQTNHVTLGDFYFEAENHSAETAKSKATWLKDPEWIFTDNETNTQKLYNSPNYTPYVKDAFHEYVVHGNTEAINPKKKGTKVASYHVVNIPANSEVVLRFRLYSAEEEPAESFGESFDAIFSQRIDEKNQFYSHRISEHLSQEERNVMNQSFAGLLWSKQFYHYIIEDWMEGDPDMPHPPAERKHGRNADWGHLFNKDIIVMPDKWEYPWFAIWDSAFHMVAMSIIDVEFAKQQLLLFLREWYMHPNGCIPAYEFNFSDVNPPVHAWATWKVYKETGPSGQRDRDFLSRVFQKLLMNFTWWVNRKDESGKHIFAGGFLGLDNIGVFDRSRPLPNGGSLEQADGTSWMAFYCIYMLKMALELAKYDHSYEDIASKFFEHFVSIATAINTLGGTGLWDKESGFYYDQLKQGANCELLKIRSLVGVVPFFAVGNLPQSIMKQLEGFNRRTQWFLHNRKDLADRIAFLELQQSKESLYLLAIPNRENVERVLTYLFDETEFLSPYGIRSVSRYHLDHPYVYRNGGEEFCVKYVSGESNTSLFGGNSNWRGPIWLCMNFLLIESLERLYNFYGESLKVTIPCNKSGERKEVNLSEAAYDLKSRLVKLFLPDSQGRRPCHGSNSLFATDPHWKDLILYYEYFDGDNGRGLGANHQTGWTALVANCLHEIGKKRAKEAKSKK